MRYCYKCKNDHTFEVWKLIKDLNRPEECPICKQIAKRDMASENQNVTFKRKPGSENMLERSGLLKGT